MSSLARYLVPLRPNPGYRVEWRHGEGGPWSPLDPTRPQGVPKGQVQDLLASPLVPLVQGDLVRVLDTKGRVAGFSVMTDEGLVALPSLADKGLRTWAGDWFRDHGFDWEAAWEGHDNARQLLYLAQTVGPDPRVLTLAGADCAETALVYVPAGEDRPRRAIETARRWARGEASEEELATARSAAYHAARDAFRVAVESAAEAAARDAAHLAARAAAEAAAEAAARDAVRDAAWGAARDAAWNAAWGAARDAALRSMAVLVRRRIPLWKLCLAAAERVPG